HAACPDRMEYRRADIARSTGELLIGLYLRPRHEFFGAIGCKRRLGSDLACEAKATHRDFAVLSMGKIVGRDGGRLARIRRPDPHMAARPGTQIADTRGKGGETV